jgi:putative ABC transport system permease protein
MDLVSIYTCKIMLRNYLKIALRTLWKNKLFSFVNIFGLSLSMAVGVLLFTRLKENYDKDHFHPKLNQIFRVITKETKEGKQTLWATTPIQLASQIGSASIIEKTVVLRHGGKHNLQTDKGDVAINIDFTEPSFFDVFGFKLLKGTPKSLSNNANSIFLSEKTVKRIFGDTSPIGKTVTFENLGLFTISGIIETPKLTSHIEIEALFSLKIADALEKNGAIPNVSQNWGEYKSSATYARLKSANDLAKFNQTISNYSRKLDKSKISFYAQSLDDITPWNETINGDNNAGISNIGILTSLFLILSLTVLSAFNYVSLSLARALSRAQEIGIRKTAGATRWQIINQFLMEATLISLLALFFTFPFINVSYNYMPLVEKGFAIDFLMIFGLLVYAIITGLVAGAIPAWFLSAFQPIQVLRKLKNVKLLRGISIYKFLIVVQFSVTIMLMVFFVILTDYEQKSSRNLAENIPENVLTLDLKNEKYENIQNEIKQLSQVEDVLATNWFYVPLALKETNVTINKRNYKLNSVGIDPKIIDTEHIKLVAGQNFAKEMPQNIEQFVLVNESVVKNLNIKPIEIIGKSFLIDSINVQVLGVMPEEKIGKPFPLIFRYLPNEVSSLTIKIKPNTNITSTKAIQNIWKENFPMKTSNIQNLKVKLTGNEMYEVIGFFGLFAMLVMIIACLGILGIASYAVEVRTKELGVRKVLGASKAKLIWTVSQNFGVLILIAGMIGVPAGWFCGNLLRQRMGSEVDLGPINMALAFGLVFIVGGISILSQTLRAGQIDVVKVLKAE